MPVYRSNTRVRHYDHPYYLTPPCNHNSMVPDRAAAYDTYGSLQPALDSVVAFVSKLGLILPDSNALRCNEPSPNTTPTSPQSPVYQPPSPKKKEPTTTRPPRPKNVFIIFRSEFCKTRRDATHADGKKVNQNELSVQAGQIWNMMSAEERKPFQRLHEEEVRRHNLMYPEHQYVPNSRKSKGLGVKPKVGKKRAGEKGAGGTVLLDDFDFLRPQSAGSVPAPSPTSSSSSYYASSESESAGAPEKVNDVQAKQVAMEAPRPSSLETGLEPQLGSLGIDNNNDHDSSPAILPFNTAVAPYTPTSALNSARASFASRLGGIPVPQAEFTPGPASSSLGDLPYNYDELPSAGLNLGPPRCQYGLGEDSDDSPWPTVPLRPDSDYINQEQAL